MMVSWKLGPALATGNTIVLKPSEFTPLTALRICALLNEAGFPPGVVNIVNGLGSTAGQRIAEHPHIEKVAFTGSTLVGRKIMETAAKTNLKKVTLELGGKSPNIIFDDADVEQAANWASHGILCVSSLLITYSGVYTDAGDSWNHGQACCAGSRIFVQAGIYDKFLTKFTEKAKSLKLGDPFANESYQGPQVSQIQFDVRSLPLSLT